MKITAAQVKELRDRTDAPMMDCKRALVATEGDIEKAIEEMRKMGQAKAAKKAGRTAAQGTIMIKMAADNARVAMAEVNCETDFVARDNNFTEFAAQVTQLAADKNIVDVDTLSATELANGQSTDEVRKALIAKIGENISIRRIFMQTADNTVGQYIHGGRIGVVVDLNGGSTELAKDMAMQVAASNPEVVSPEDVSDATVAKEKEIFMAQAEQSGKPKEIIEKMIEGRLRKFREESSLLGQPYVKDPKQTVKQLLAAASAQVLKFERFEVGEGIEVQQTNFAEEVRAQVAGEA